LILRAVNWPTERIFNQTEIYFLSWYNFLTLIITAFLFKRCKESINKTCRIGLSINKNIILTRKVHLIIEKSNIKHVNIDNFLQIECALDDSNINSRMEEVGYRHLWRTLIDLFKHRFKTRFEYSFKNFNIELIDLATNAIVNSIRDAHFLFVNS